MATWQYSWPFTTGVTVFGEAPVATSCLMAVQSPPYFLNPDNKDSIDKAVDWGKMEDVE